MRKYFVLLLILLQTLSVIAQQLPEVSFYMYDYTRTNPGSIGSTDMVCITGINKNSLMNFPGKATDLYLNAEMPFKLFGGKHGVGISFYSDVIGYYSDIDLKLGYAYRFSVGEGTLGIGINGGLRQRSLDGRNWHGTSTIDPTNDPNIPQGDIKDVKAANIGAGIFYRTEDIYFGASVLNLYSQEFDYSEGTTTGTASTAKETLVPHFYVTSGYSLQLNNPSYEIQPSVNFFSDGSSITFDINGTLTYNKKIWGGVSYRVGSAAVGMIGLMILDGLKVGYAYDFQTSALNKYSAGSHEIMMNYCFKLGGEKIPQRYKSIRYL